MSPREINQILFFGGAALGIVGLVCALKAISRLGRFLRVMRAPARTVAQATPGVRAAFELTAVGVEGQPVLAPFSERQCLWCKAAVWERRGKRSVLTVADRTDRTLHAVDANNHAVRVVTDRMEVDLPFENLAGGGKRWLRERGLAQGVIRYTFSEARIERNDPIIVVGDLSVAPDGQPQIVAYKTLDMLITRGPRRTAVRKQVALSVGGLLVFVGLFMMWSVFRRPDRRATPTPPAKIAPAPTTRTPPTTKPPARPNAPR